MGSAVSPGARAARGPEEQRGRRGAGATGRAQAGAAAPCAGSVTPGSAGKSSFGKGVCARAGAGSGRGSSAGHQRL